MNQGKIIRRNELAATVSMLLAIGPAWAQQNQGAEEEPEIVEEDKAQLERFEVTGFVQSLEQSREIKMMSDSIVEVVTAEEMGKLPDVSIAESLARLPGLTAQRLNGRGQVISVRGLAPDFTTALLNGREQVSTGDNRGVEFDQYPAELINAAVVYKTPDAQLIGQGLAGTVDMRTIRPLEYGERRVAANIRYEWNDIEALNADAEDAGERLTLSYVNQFADDTVGLALGVAHQATPSQGERFNSWGYPTLDDGSLIIGGSKPFVQSNNLERQAFIGVLEYEPSDRFNTSFDVYYSDFEEEQSLRGIELPLFWSSAQLQPGFQVENGLVTQGVFDGVKGVVRNDLNFREAELWAFGWNTEFAVTDAWTLEFDVSYSGVDRQDELLESYSGTGPAGEGPFDTLGFTVGGEGADFDPSIDYSNPNNLLLTSPQGWGGDIIPGGQLGYTNRPSIEDELTHIRASARRELDLGFVDQMEIGFDFATREKSLVADEFFLALAGGQTAVPIPNVNGITNLGFLGLGGLASYDPRALIANGTYSLVRNPNADVVTKSWNVEEDVNLAYVQFGVDTAWGNVPITGNFGFQVVNTDQSSNAFASSGTGDSVFSQPISGGQDYTEVLPSLNLTFDLGNSNLVRFAAARTLARPRMDQMRASINYSFDVSRVDETDINNSPWGGGGGNPELDPWLANAFDLSYEKYFDDGVGYFSAAVFYKDLESYIFDEVAVFDFSGFETGGFDPVLTQGLVTTPQNGEGGEITGLELALSLNAGKFVPALDGFGFIANASFTDSEIQPDPNNDATPLPGLSEDVANLTLYYEKAGFGARVSGRYRSDFLGEVAGFGNGRNLRMVESETVVDAQLSYAFNAGPLNGLTLLFQAFNVTDEEFTTINGDDSRQVIDYQRYGRSYLVGLSFQY